MKEVTTTAADVLVEQLYSWGVRYAWGIPGASILPVVSAMQRSGKIQFMLVRHEQTAAFMASAWGKLTGEIGVCVSIAGPGSTNLTTGLYDADADGAPVLALTGQVRRDWLGSAAFQEVDQHSLFDPIAVYNEVLAAPRQVIEVIPLAMKHALLRRGVAHVGLPNDVQRAPFNMNPKPRETNMAEPDYMPGPEKLDEAAWAISQSQHPMIFAGAGALAARDTVVALAEKLSAPVATTCRAKGIIPEDHPLSMGVLDSLGPAHVPQVARGADLMIVVGSGFRQRHLLPKVPSVQIDMDPVAVGRDFPLAVGLIGNTRLTLPAVLERVEPRQPNRFCEDVARARNRYWEQLQPMLSSNQHPIAPQRLVNAINQAVAPDAIISLDVGHHTYWMGQVFKAQRQEFLISSLVASMGFGLPSGLASALARPDRQSVVVSGDGGFAMVMGDFTTAVKYNIPVKIVLFDDGILSRVVSEQAAENIPDVGTRLQNPDFAEFARSAGGKGYRVENPEELDETLVNAFAEPGPVLVDVKIDPAILAKRTQ